MADYKIGQILTSTEDVEIEKALSGEKVKIPKGNKIIIGADKFAHHIRNGFIQPLAEGLTVEGMTLLVSQNIFILYLEITYLLMK